MKTLVIDDERLARKELINLLDGYTEVEIIGECSNADEAIDMIKEKQPDLIFLDIQMPGKDGFEMLEELGSWSVASKTVHQTVASVGPYSL